MNRAIRANLFCFAGNMLPARTACVEGVLREPLEVQIIRWRCLLDRAKSTVPHAGNGEFGAMIADPGDSPRCRRSHISAFCVAVYLIRVL